MKDSSPRSDGQPLEPMTVMGGCHCGAVRFQVTLRKREAIVCNCSICTKKGFLHYIVPPEDFSLLREDEALSNYQFNTKTAHHLFCQHCGIHSFYRPRSHPKDWDVNLHCLDQAGDSDFMEQFTYIRFNGQAWEENVSEIR